MFLSKILYETTNSGYPILINTSLNARGKPIINSVSDYRKEIKNDLLHSCHTLSY